MQQQQQQLQQQQHQQQLCQCLHQEQLWCHVSSTRENGFVPDCQLCQWCLATSKHVMMYVHGVAWCVYMFVYVWCVCVLVVLQFICCVHMWFAMCHIQCHLQGPPSCPKDLKRSKDLRRRGPKKMSKWFIRNVSPVMCCCHLCNVNTISMARGHTCC